MVWRGSQASTEAGFGRYQVSGDGEILREQAVKGYSDPINGNNRHGLAKNPVIPSRIIFLTR